MPLTRRPVPRSARPASAGRSGPSTRPARSAPAATLALLVAALALGATTPATTAAPDAPVTKPAPPLAPTSPDSADVESLHQELDALVTGHVGETTPGAMVAVVGSEGPLLTETWGMADPATQAPLTPESRTPVASVSKVVTALTALTLHHEGLLDLDADIREYLPVRDERDAEVQDPVTARQLLTHHSGIVESLLFHPEPLDAPYTGTLLDWLAEHPPTLELPGAGLHYSPMQAYALLGAAIEQATGGSFDDAVERWVLDPVGAITADFHGLGTQPGDVVLATRDGDGWSPTEWPAVIERPAANLTWSATDAVAVLQALLGPSGGALPAEVVDQAMTTAVRPNHGAGGHTQVFFEEWRADVRVLEHAGANGLAWLAVVPEAGIGVFTAVTTEDLDAAPLTSEVLDTVVAWTASTGLASAQPPPPGGLPAIEPDWVAPTEPAMPVGTFHERLFGPRGPELPLRSLVNQLVREDGEHLLLGDRRYAPSDTEGRWCDDVGCIAGARAADGTVLLLRGERGMLEQTLVPAPWWADLWFVGTAVAGTLALGVVAVAGAVRAGWRGRRDRPVPTAVSRPTAVAWSLGCLTLVVATPLLSLSPLLASSSAWLDAGGPAVWALRAGTAAVLVLGVVWLVEAARGWDRLSRVRRVAAVPAALIGLAMSVVLVSWALPAA